MVVYQFTVQEDLRLSQYFIKLKPKVGSFRAFKFLKDSIKTY